MNLILVLSLGTCLGVVQAYAFKMIRDQYVGMFGKLFYSIVLAMAVYCIIWLIQNAYKLA